MDAANIEFPVYQIMRFSVLGCLTALGENDDSRLEQVRGVWPVSSNLALLLSADGTSSPKTVMQLTGQSFCTAVLERKPFRMRKIGRSNALLTGPMFRRATNLLTQSVLHVKAAKPLAGQ